MRLWVIEAALVIGIATMVGAVGVVLYQRTQVKEATVPQNSSSVSGTFDINGVVPENATITITKRIYTANTVTQTAAQNISPIDNGPWSLPNVTSGTSYEIVAQMIVNGKVVATSS